MLTDQSAALSQAEKARMRGTRDAYEHINEDRQNTSSGSTVSSGHKDRNWEMTRTQSECCRGSTAQRQTHGHKPLKSGSASAHSPSPAARVGDADSASAASAASPTAAPAIAAAAEVRVRKKQRTLFWYGAAYADDAGHISGGFFEEEGPGTGSSLLGGWQQRRCHRVVW